MKNKIRLLVLVLITCLSNLNAQMWTHYTEKNSGLTSESISDIEIDNQNRLWISTYSGISVFDGINKWVNYRTDNSGLISNFVFDMEIDSAGNKWFATSSGISKFDGTNWTSYTIANSGMARNVTRSIAINSKGKIYFGQTDNYISILEGNKWSTYRVGFGNLRDVNCMAISKNDNVYFSLQKAGLYLLAGSQLYILDAANNGVYDDDVQSICIDESNAKVWVGSNYALNMMTSTGFSYYTWEDWENIDVTGSNIRGIAVDKSNNKWFGTEDGLIKFDGIKFSLYSKKNNGLPHDWVENVVIDKDGIFWLKNGGLTRFNPKATVGLEMQDLINISIYPNPTQGVISITNIENISEVLVMDNLGRVLISEPEFEGKLDIHNLVSGQYFLKVVTKNGVVTKSIIKY